MASTVAGHGDSKGMSDKRQHHEMQSKHLPPETIGKVHLDWNSQTRVGAPASILAVASRQY
jgi:hypothetical protein